MAKQTDRELAQKIRSQLMECAGWDGDSISSDRKKALDYYYQRPKGNEQPGRSNVVAGDVSAMVEANLAQMLDSFSSKQIAEFDALGPLDDDQAQLESYAVTAAVMADNNGYQELGTAIKDGLLSRNGWFKCYVEEKETVETLDLENATPEVIAEMRSAPALTLEILEYDDDALTARVRVTHTTKNFVAESLDPGNVLYQSQWDKCDVQRIPFMAERHLEPRSELIRRGFPKRKVAALKKYDQDYKLDTVARDVRRDVPIAESIDASQDLIEWFECYALVDSGDGTSERRRISVAGVSHDSILENEPVSLVPYATGSPFINPHRLTGISIWDKLRQTQDLNTGLQRALMDNVNTVIKNRVAYLDGKVNTDDLADGRPNGSIRVKASAGNVNNAITAFQQPDISGGILSNLEYQRQVRTELGGASLELATGQMQMAGGRIGSQGIDRAFSVMEQLASHMTKNMATSLIRNVFLLAHATMREYFDTPVPINVNGRWQSPVPALWRPRTRVTVKIGMSPGERARKVATYEKIIDAQIGLAREGMDEVLVNIDGFYRALTDWGRAADLPNPEQYFVDPQTPEAQQAIKAKQDQAAQQEAQSRALMATAVGLEQVRTAFDKYRADQETTLEVWKETLRAEIEEAKIVGKATADLVSQTKFGSNANGAEQPRTGSNGSSSVGREAGIADAD